MVVSFSQARRRTCSIDWVENEGRGRRVRICREREREVSREENPTKPTPKLNKWMKDGEVIPSHQQLLQVLVMVFVVLLLRPCYRRWFKGGESQPQPRREEKPAVPYSASLG